MTRKEKLERVLNTPDRELRAFQIHAQDRQPTSVSKENRLILRRGIGLVLSLGLFSVLALLPVQAQVFTGDLTLSTQADVDAFGLRRTRYRGQAKTHLQHVVTATAINLERIWAWLEGVPHSTTRTSRFAALAA